MIDYGWDSRWPVYLSFIRTAKVPTTESEIVFHPNWIRTNETEKEALFVDLTWFVFLSYEMQNVWRKWTKKKVSPTTEWIQYIKWKIMQKWMQILHKAVFPLFFFISDDDTYFILFKKKRFHLFVSIRSTLIAFAIEQKSE